MNDPEFNFRHAIRDLDEWSQRLAAGEWPGDLERLGMDQVVMVERAAAELRGLVEDRERGKVRQALVEALELAMSAKWPNTPMMMIVERPFPWEDKGGKQS